MKVALEKTFPMPGSAQVVWSLLQNVEAVAGCMPGARITEQVDATHFKGTIAVKVGPASMSFKGDIEVREIDPVQRVLRLMGKGSDSSGTSGASMDLTARVEPDASNSASNLVGRSEVTLSGKAAAFGGRMMGTVADQILKQFAANFAQQVRAAATTQATATTAAIRTIAPEETGVAATTPPPPTSPTTAPDNETPVVAAAAAPAKPSQLNALPILWAIIRDWFRGLFRRKPA